MKSKMFLCVKQLKNCEKLVDNDEETSEREVYFAVKDISFYKKCIDMLDKSWTDCINLEGNYVGE